MRGTANNEPVVSQARTKEFEQGYDRIFGPDKKPERGRWVWDVDQQRLVRAEDYRPPEHAVNAPILSGRFYENTKATDGTDIGSRRKHREYMKANNLTTMDDYTQTWAKAEQERKAMREGKIPSKTRREVLERAWYEKFQR